MALGGALILGDGKEAGAASLVERLGHPPTARLLMIHADDVGMCRSVNRTSIHALTEGSVSSASAMVPCPWFPALAAWLGENPQADVGLHLTLTSEWRHYRWGPVAPAAEVPGLVDPDGFLWRRVEDVVAHAKPREVEREIRAQIARARHFGMRPTHVDSHMGTLFETAGFFEAYVRVAREEKLVPMLPEITPDLKGAASILERDYAPALKRLRGEGYVVIDRLVLSLEGDDLEARRRSFHALLDGLKPGVTELIVHLSGDDDEARNITGSWPRRHAEYRLFTDPATRKAIADRGISLVGYRELGRLFLKS